MSTNSSEINLKIDQIAKGDNSLDNYNPDRKEIAQQLSEEELKRYTDDSWSRKVLMVWAAIVVSIWLLLVIFILTFNNLFNFQLSDTVLSVLLGTTTLNVLGLMIIVLQDLFRGKLERKFN